MSHSIGEAVLDHHDRTVGGRAGARDDAASILKTHFYGPATGRGEPVLNVVHCHGVSTAQLASDGPSAVRVHDHVAAVVNSAGITATGPDQLQALALRHPAQPGLTDLLCGIHD